MGKAGLILKHQNIWESLTLPKDYQIERQFSNDPMIIFVVTGNVRLKMNNEEVHSVFSREMFIARFDDFYEITTLEQTHLLICHAPMEVWFTEQKWLDELILDDEKISPEELFKLPINKVIIRFLSLLDIYLKEGIDIPTFYFIKRQELFILFFTFYKKHNLARFLHHVISKDVKFKRIVLNNYSNARNVQELAKLANYSTSGFIKRFQKCFNESPYKWMQKQKAKQIAVDINRGIKSLQEIANDHNFLSFQHFSVFCKSKLGATPTLIYKKSKENLER